MRLSMRILIAIMAVLAAAGCKSGKVRTCDAGKEKVLVIFYDSAFSPDSLAEIIESYGSGIIYRYHVFNGFAVTVPEGKTEEEAISHFREMDGILLVRPDRKMQLHESGYNDAK